jgi:hypothetical protein
MTQIDLVHGVALSIRIKIADRCQLIFRNATKELEVESDFSRDQLKREREGLRRDLEEFQNSFVAPDQRPLRDVGEALSQLHFRGRTILHHLFGSDEKLMEARDICREACPNWERPGWDSASLAPHLIEVRTAVDHGIPIDLLPLLDPLKPAPAETMDDLARAAGTLLGFSGIVRRTFGDVPDERRLRIENADSFPLKMFWDGSLPGARTARRFFDENSAHFDPKGGPWPDGTESSDENEFCEAVADYLADPESSFDGGPHHQSDQLCYFFCHCDTRATNPDDYVLYLGRGEWFGKRYGVKLQYLSDELHQRNLRHLDKGRKIRPRPLVFLNACGSAVLDPMSATSFPKLFLSKSMGFLGFIGTEATVPDWFGSEFAEVFYRHFVGGMQLGRALHAARWYMLRKYRSPLGILYTLYADPEIEVRNRVESLREKLLGQ